MKILVAEDDATSLLILRRAIEKAGHECVTAGNGEEAWRLYKETPGLNVIISDWMMPDVDGLELCRRVRAEEREGYTYFIFLTALGDKEHLLQGFEAGADDYLSKPLDRAELEMRLISARRLTTLHERLDEQRAELERLNGLLADQARKDPLTGLGNRLRMREDLDSLNARARRYGQGYGVILCDVDCFKLYNDTQGHLAGDEVLRKLAKILSETVRTGDSVYRYGGEEFLALLPEQSIEDSKHVAKRLRSEVERLGIPHEARAHPAIITISAGVSSTLSSDGTGVSSTSDELLEAADEELYKAKGAGRNRVFARDEA